MKYREKRHNTFELLNNTEIYKSLWNNKKGTKNNFKKHCKDHSFCSFSYDFKDNTNNDKTFIVPENIVLYYKDELNPPLEEL